MSDPAEQTRRKSQSAWSTKVFFVSFLSTQPQHSSQPHHHLTSTADWQQRKPGVQGISVEGSRRRQEIVSLLLEKHAPDLRPRWHLQQKIACWTILPKSRLAPQSDSREVGTPSWFCWCSARVLLGSAGVLLGLCWGSAGVLLGFCWGSAGVLRGFCLGSAGVLLGFCWGSAGVLLGFRWGSAGVLLGFCWDFCWGSAGMLQPNPLQHDTCNPTPATRPPQPDTRNLTPDTRTQNEWFHVRKHPIL